LDVISGDVASYVRCSIDPNRLKEIKEANQLAAAVAAVVA